MWEAKVTLKGQVTIPKAVRTALVNLTGGLPEMAEEIAPTLIQFLHADGLEVESLDLLTEALALYHEQNLDFADALVATVARRKGPPTVYSFDHDFDRVAGLTRLTPG